MYIQYILFKNPLIELTAKKTEKQVHSLQVQCT
jgi:hypothetical protein